MSDIDQQARADAYHRNMIALIWAARVEYEAHIRDRGEDVDAAIVRHRLRGMVAIVEQVEAGHYHDICEGCGKPLIDGQIVIPYEDAGDVHADCDDPSKAYEDQQGIREYDSGFRPEQCARELAAAKAVLADA